MLTQELMKEVRRLQVRTRRRVDGLFAGEYHTAFKGRGMEFADVREYEPGDDVRAIDWNVTARTGKTFIKRFIEERELTVTLAVDLSRSGAFGSAIGPNSRLKRQLAVESAAVLALSAATNSDRVGLVIFTDRIELIVPPAKGRKHVLRVLRELLNFEPESHGTDIATVLHELGHVLPRRGLVFVVSDFLESPSAAPIETPLRMLARRHEVIAVQIADKRESDLPSAGLIELVDAETGETGWLDTSSRSARAAYSQAAANREQRLLRTLTHAKVDRVRLTTDRPFVPEFARYFRLRERRR